MQRNFLLRWQMYRAVYQAIPYGWKEIDIAVVAAMLIYDQKVTIKYGGETIQPGNPKLPDMLRKRAKSVRPASLSVRLLQRPRCVRSKTCFVNTLM